MPARGDVQLIIKAVNQASGALRDVQRDVESLNTPVKQLGQLWNAAVGAGAVYAVGRLAGQVYELGKAGAQLSELRDAFQQVIPEADKMLETLKRASGGTIAEMQLMAAANKAAMLNVTKDAETMGQLMEIARYRARVMGIDTSYALESMVVGLGRNSKLWLDNLGIIIDDTAAYEKFAASIGKSADELTDLEKRQVLTNEVLRIGNDELRKVGGLTDSDADAFRRFESATTDLRLALAENVGKLDIWNDLADTASGMAERAAENYGDLEAAAYGYADGQLEANKRMAQFVALYDPFEAAWTALAGLSPWSGGGFSKGGGGSGGGRGGFGGSDEPVPPLPIGQKLATGMLLKDLAPGGMPGKDSMAWLNAYYDALDEKQREQLRKEEEAAKETKRIWESAYSDMENLARGAMGGLTFSFDYASEMDRLGFHQETWDEEARRAMDVVNQGAASPWYQQMIEKGQLTPERLAEFGGDPRAAAADWIHEFEMGQHPEAVNMDAVNKAMREGLTKDANWEGLWGGLATTWMGLVDKDKEKLQGTGKAAGRQVMSGVEEAVKTETSITQMIAESVAPIVWNIIKGRQLRSGMVGGGIPQ